MKIMITSLFALFTSVLAYSAEYSCSTPDQMGDSLLTINQENNSISITDTVWCDDFTAALDTSFRPRTLKGFLKFESKDCMADGRTFVLIEDKILKGLSKGQIKVQSRGETFENYNYSCVKR